MTDTQSLNDHLSCVTSSMGLVSLDKMYLCAKSVVVHGNQLGVSRTYQMLALPPRGSGFIS